MLTGIAQIGSNAPKRPAKPSWNRRRADCQRPKYLACARPVLGRAADALARHTGFVQRQRKITASAFVETLVFGWLDAPDAPLSHLADTAAAIGCPVAAQSLDARFSEPAAHLLEAVPTQALAAVVTGPDVTSGLLARFDGVDLIDSTVVSLPAVAAERWPGLGGNTPARRRSRSNSGSASPTEPSPPR